MAKMTRKLQTPEARARIASRNTWLCTVEHLELGAVLVPQTIHCMVKAPWQDSPYEPIAIPRRMQVVNLSTVSDGVFVGIDSVHATRYNGIDLEEFDYTKDDVWMPFGTMVEVEL